MWSCRRARGRGGEEGILTRTTRRRRASVLKGREGRRGLSKAGGVGDAVVAKTLEREEGRRKSGHLTEMEVAHHPDVIPQLYARMARPPKNRTRPGLSLAGPPRGSSEAGRERARRKERERKGDREVTAKGRLFLAEHSLTRCLLSTAITRLLCSASAVFLLVCKEE